MTASSSTLEDEASLASYLHQVSSAPSDGGANASGSGQANQSVQAGKRPRRA